jgi:hypothetical protein
VAVAQNPQRVEEFGAEIRGATRLPRKRRQRLQDRYVTGIAPVSGLGTPDRNEELTLDAERVLEPIEEPCMTAHHLAAARDERRREALRQIGGKVWWRLRLHAIELHDARQRRDSQQRLFDEVAFESAVNRLLHECGAPGMERQRVARTTR